LSAGTNHGYHPLLGQSGLTRTKFIRRRGLA
jgi:hypothetical protein